MPKTISWIFIENIWLTLDFQLLSSLCHILSDYAHKTLSRGKSILSLGARQTGKTTFVREELKPDIEISFASRVARLRYEKNPELLEQEIQGVISKFKRPRLFLLMKFKRSQQSWILYNMLLIIN